MSDTSTPIILLLSGLFLFAACSTDNQHDNKLEKKASGSVNSPKKISYQKVLQASLDGNITVVKEAVSQGIDVTGSDKSGRTPLMLASYNGHFEIVQYLLKQGSDPNKSNNQGQTPLIFAASGSNPKTVEVLLENGADPNKTSTNEKWSPLMWAAAEGNERVIEILLKHDADPNLRDNDDETAREFAESNGYESIAEILKQAEVNNSK